MSERIETTEAAIAAAEAAFSDPSFGKKPDTPVVEQKIQEPIAHEEVVHELTEFEQEQKALGWNPKGEKSAKEWADAAPLYKAITEKNNENKILRRTVEELREFMSQQKQIAYDQALAQLNAERNAAISKGDHQALQEVDAKRANLTPVPKGLPQALLDFQERNSKWLTGTSYTEMEMTNFAKQRDNELMERKLPVEEHMLILEEHIKAKFPTYFGKTEAPPVPGVEGGTGAGVVSRTKTRYTFQDLNQEQKQVAKDFERMKVMTVDKYIADLVAMGDLK